jgi:hypothetical protein
MQIGASDFQGTMPVTIMRRIPKRDVKAHPSPRLLFRQMLPEQLFRGQCGGACLALNKGARAPE